MPACKPTGGQNRTTRDADASGNSKSGIAILVKYPSSRKNGTTWTTGAVRVEDGRRVRFAQQYADPDLAEPARLTNDLGMSQSGRAASGTMVEP